MVNFKRLNACGHEGHYEKDCINNRRSGAPSMAHDINNNNFLEI